MLQKLKMPLKYLNYRRGSLTPSTYPDRLYVESTNMCNLKCVMCPNGLGLMKRPKGYMDFDLFKSVMDEMAPHVKATTVHIWGEALMHPRIVDMIEYAKQFPLEVEISTNGTLLDERMCGRLMESGLDEIYLCLDGINKDTYEAVRCAADFETTHENIERFVDTKARLGLQRPFVNLQIIDMAPTKSEIDSFRRAWQRPGVDHINVKAFDSWGNQVENISDLRAENPDIPDTRWACPNLWYHAHVYWDGTLVCCDRDFDARFPLGNVRDGVMKVWNGERMMALRAKHLSGDLDDVPSCKNCVEWAWWHPTWFRSRGNAPEQRNGKKEEAAAAAVNQPPAEDESLWDDLYIKDSRQTEEKCKFDWFSSKAYAEYGKWLSPFDGKILDAGFGTGRFCLALAKDYPGSEIHGLDISQNLVDDANRAAGHLELENATFHRGDILNMPFPDNTFDVVFNEGVIEHLPEYEDAFREMVRVAKPGGKIIVGVPNLYCLPHTIRKGLIRLLGMEFEYDIEKSFIPGELMQMFKRNGVRNVENTGYYSTQSIIRLFWVTKIAQVAWRLQRVFDVCEGALRLAEKYFIGMIDAATQRAFSKAFGFEIVVKGVK